MRLIPAINLTPLKNYTLEPGQIAHYFKRINQNHSIHFCSLLYVLPNQAVLINRYSEQDTFQYFFKKFQLLDSYNLLLLLAGKNTWQGLMACENYLLRSHKTVFKRQPISRTVVHSLDFMTTAGFNKVYLDINSSAQQHLNVFQP